MPRSGGSSSLANQFVRGDEVTCSVTARDAQTDGNTISHTVEVMNSKPLLGGCTIGPATPKTTDSIVVLSLDNWSDPDPQDTTAGADYAWFVNGTLDPSQTGNSYPAASTEAGDVITVQCTANDGFDTGNTVTSNAINIDNTPPTINDCTLSSLSPTTTQSLTASLEDWFDADNTPAGANYVWYVNNIVVSGANTATLSSSAFGKGDEVYVVCEPDDGTATGTPITSSTATVINSAPSITDCSLTNVGPTTTEDLTAVYSGWSDPDSIDSPAVIYIWTLNGVVDSSATSNKYGSANTRKGDVIGVQCIAWDGDAEGNLIASPNATVVNTPPVVSSANITAASNGSVGDTFTCSYTFVDADNDPNESKYYMDQRGNGDPE